MNTVYYCGNNLVFNDRGPVGLVPQLKKTIPEFSFIHLDPTEGIPEDQVLLILDTVIGIDKVTVFDSLHRFTVPPRFTVHDYDLLHDLHILIKLKKITVFHVIGIPETVKNSDLLEVIKVLKSIFILPS